MMQNGNPYSKLGIRLRAFMMVTLVYFLLELLDTYVVYTGIAGFIAIAVLVFQILVILDAKGVANSFNKPDLSRFANYLIGSFVPAFASVIVLFIILFQIALGLGSGSVSVGPILMASAIIGLLNSLLVLAAWFAFYKFFKGVNAIDIPTSGLTGVYLVIVGTFAIIADFLAVGFPNAILNNVSFIPQFSGSRLPFDVIGLILVMFANVLVIVGYFKVANTIIAFGIIVSGTSSAPTVDKDVILSCENLTKMYISGLLKTKVTAGAKNVTFSIKRGEIVCLAGESGSGKSTVAKMILRLIEPTSGRILYDGKSIFSYGIRDYYKKVQAIFQDPYSAFNPFYRVDHVLDKAFSLRDDHLDPGKKKKIIESTLKSIGLNPDEVLGRHPHQLSGGQMQRLLIGRALLIGSQLLIADEPTSMIDASTRAGILNLLLTLKRERGLSVLFITHDIGQAQYVSERVLVMKKGEVVDQGPIEEVFQRPKHPYTKELLAAVPSLHEKWEEFA